MKWMMRTGVLAAALVVWMPAAAHAQWEVETDPIAFGLRGFSGHVGRQIAGGAGRLQIGVFGADVPEVWHGHDGVDIRARGVAVKADYFFGGHPGGLFVGVDGVYTHTRYQRDATGSETTRNGSGIGPRVGYRFNIGAHLYITPWVSVSYLFNTDDVMLGGERLEQKSYMFFPTVHVGWRF